MARIKVWRVFLGLAASGFLSACVETVASPDSGTGAATGPGTSARAGAEVEAPEVFQANEAALWDGRPSLGGIWVASPDAKDPERVVMFNPATGKTVKGALFRRERENPGPRLQLSSDAAEALGVLAGAPTEIEVTALRKVEVEEPAAPEVPAATEEPDVATPAATEAGKDAAEVAAAALDAVDAGAAAETDAATVAVEEPAKPLTWKEKRAAAKAEREAKKAAEAAAAAAAAGETAVEGEAPVTPDAVAGSEIDSAPLDAVTPEATEDTASKAKPAAEAEEVVVADPAPAATGGAARTIQIGSFSKEENAKRAVEALSKIDIVAEVKKVEKDGKIIWGVVARGDAALLQKIKDAGFADAYFLK